MKNGIIIAALALLCASSLGCAQLMEKWENFTPEQKADLVCTTPADLAKNACSQLDEEYRLKCGVGLEAIKVSCHAAYAKDPSKICDLVKNNVDVCSGLFNKPAEAAVCQSAFSAAHAACLFTE